MWGSGAGAVEAAAERVPGGRLRAAAGEGVPAGRGCSVSPVSLAAASARTGCARAAGRCHTLPALSAGAQRCSALAHGSPCPDRCPAVPEPAAGAGASCCSSLSLCHPRSRRFLCPCCWAAGCARPAQLRGTWRSSGTAWTMPSEAPRAARSARRRS